MTKTNKPTKTNIDYSIYSASGKMVYERQTSWEMDGKTWTSVRRVVPQADGSLWMYAFNKGEKPMAPLRGKARQAEMVEIKAEIEASLRN